jgi:ATP-binding cassette, subfamily F, member 3
LSPQDRIALVGPNGSGKSTLTRMLAGEAPLLAGTRAPAADLAIGYFAQQQMEQLRGDSSAFWHVRNHGGADFASGDEQRVRDHLGRFGFQGDRAFEPVARFSGGEKARLTLALLVARRPNLLLLDEPTNHLDIEMRHALTVALQGFEGGLIVVSHDRHLIKTVADTLWLAADGKVKVFDGDLEDYQAWLKARIRTREEPAAERAKAEKPKADPLAELRRELAQIERRIANIAAELKAVEAELGRGDATGKLAEKNARLVRDAAKWEARWMEVGTALEAAEAQS